MSDPKISDGDPRLPALLQWRQQLIASGAVSASTFKEAHVRLVLRSGRRDVEQIRSMLPGSVAEHAEDMARVLDELTTEPTEPAPPADETGAGRARAQWAEAHRGESAEERFRGRRRNWRFSSRDFVLYARTPGMIPDSSAGRAFDC